ncbi:MAG: tRNA threonylcarbamoyladenosine dehydratase [Deltaproteobacteria bacterium]|nr:tRNA threonylcarbamoyladenosine dehydratase [Sandaracinaceae bacterium]MCX7808722.1 tRNA threonylcarbamoyladenosine dehydratase [Deltaproteobacteria bacterium]MDW8246265.1 tRNA threonylcarbamoyladenosine dehydratase [Sandaracinaceae bacterium]
MPLPIVGANVKENNPSSLRTHRRFDRAARLFTEPGLHRLMQSRVMIFGMGGVGSFAAEALARSGIGHLFLVDFDEVCVTNTNRQLHALKNTIGKPKAEIMAERLRLISPTAQIEPICEFYEAARADRFLGMPLDFVVDAIDSISSKAHLLSECVRRGVPVVSSMGAAGRLDPTRIRIADLSDTEGCALARDLRKILRKKYGLRIERGARSGIWAIYSDEPVMPPAPLSYDSEKGFVCVCPNKENGKYTCDHRARIDGSAAFVTGAFGLAAASVVVRELIAQQRLAHLSSLGVTSDPARLPQPSPSSLECCD